MFLFVRPAVAPAVSLFLALLAVLAPGVVDVAQAQTVSLRFSSTMLAENGGTATVTATVAPPSTTPFTVDVSAVATVDSDPSMGRVTVSGTTLNFAANAMTSTGTVTITAIDNDGHTPQLRGGVIVTVSGTVTGGTGVTEPLDEELEIVEDDGIGTATDMTRPVMLMGSGAVEGDRVTLVFTEALKSDRTPRPILFHVIIDGNLIVRPRTVEVIGYRVFLTLREPVEPASVVSVGYNPPKHNNLDIDLTRALQDLAGIPVYATRQTSLDNDTKPRVELVLTPSSIDENGGVSVVTATVPEASMTPFTVEVAVTPVAPATADDVTVSSNTVLSFAANATESTGVVTITAVDNGAEEDDLEVTVSGTLGAGASDVSGPMDLTLTILDDEAPSRPAQPTQPAGTASIQKPWLARFGRMTAQYVLDGVRQRLTAPRAAGLRGRLAGQAFSGTAPQPDRLRNVPGDAAASNPFRSRRVTARDLLTGTAFALTGATGGGSFALWGQGGHRDAAAGRAARRGIRLRLPGLRRAVHRHAVSRARADAGRGRRPHRLAPRRRAARRRRHDLRPGSRPARRRRRRPGAHGGAAAHHPLVGGERGNGMRLPPAAASPPRPIRVVRNPPAAAARSRVALFPRAFYSRARKPRGGAGSALAAARRTLPLKRRSG